jgi:hypothetical protein
VWKEAAMFYLGKSGKYVIFQVLMEANMKFGVFWDVAPCIEVNADLTTRCYIPEDSINFILSQDSLFRANI